MAIDLPTTSLQLKRSTFLHKKPILSGGDTGAGGLDAPYGAAGMVGEAHHQYGYLWQQIAAQRAPDAVALAAENGTGAYVLHFGPFKIHMGADFVKIRLVVDIDDGYAQVRSLVGGSAATALSTGRSVKTADMTLSAATGIEDTIVVDLKADVGIGGFCYCHGLAIYEIPMVAGDFP